MLSAIIVAGGSSVRAGFDKLFSRIENTPVVAHAVDAFGRCGEVDEIIVVGRADRLVDLREMFSGRGKVSQVIGGGVRRQDSVIAGLGQVAAAATYIAVHDAARPLTTPDLISRVFASARLHGAAAAAAPVVDTLKRANAEHIVSGSVDRAHLYGMQTPQIFERALLERAYRSTIADDIAVTDEVSAVERMGEKVVLVPADDFNFKVTYAADLQLAEFVLRGRATSR